MSATRGEAVVNQNDGSGVKIAIIKSETRHISCQISDKHRHHNSTIYGSSMPYFMRLSCAAFGLHQGYVPSYPASHGCIRVPMNEN